MKLALVIPVYNEAESLPRLLEEVQEVLNGLKTDSEVLFIDDGSSDGSDKILEEAARKIKAVRLVKLRRHFGKSAALECGFRRTQADIIVTLDADLQDDPREIPRLIEKIEEGYDLVSGWKKKRQDPWHKTIPSKIYNRVTSRVTGIRLHDFNCGLKAFRKQVLKEIDVYGELHRFIPVLAGWRGFKMTEIEIHHRKRMYGKSKFGFSRLLAGFLDLMTAYYVTRFSKKPSRLFGVLGLFFFICGAAIDLHLFLVKITGGMIGRRQPYMMMGILLTLLGVQFIFVGLLSELMVYFYHRFKKEYSVEYER